MNEELYAKNDLVKIVASGEQPGFKYRLDSEKFVGGMREVAASAKGDGLQDFAQVYEAIADTINLAREGKSIEPKILPKGITQDSILSNLPFNEFLNRLDVLNYICLATDLTYGKYKN